MILNPIDTGTSDTGGHSKQTETGVVGPFILNLKLKTCGALAASVLVAQVFAQEFAFRSGDLLDAETLSVQEKAEQLFEEGDYKRAHFIYLKELAPIGDKYAQYMVGFMTLSGLGVAEDPILASAWYRLAAERKTPEFIAVRDDLIRRLDRIDMEQSDATYSRLRLEYSDIVVRMREVREDFERIRTGPTGSRTANSSSPVMIVQPRSGAGMSVEAYNQQLLRRMQKHLDYIVAALGIDHVDAEASEEELDRLEQQVMTYAARVDDL
jgi:hypothetical protein